MITLNDCLKYEQEGWLNKHESADGKLIGFKYSLKTVYEQHWDEVTLCCRGIVFDKKTKQIIAWPFNKFFNYQEVFSKDGKLNTIGKILNDMTYEWQPFISKKFTVAEKVDGSLGIAYFYNGEWYVKTGGSFESDQAKWATDYLRKNLKMDDIINTWTLCFEIVYHNDPHVVHYNKEELVLLSIFQNSDHYEFSRNTVNSAAKMMGCRAAEYYQFNSIEETLQKVSEMDVNHEGVVVTFDGFDRFFKVKIKSNEYLEMFHRMNSITYKEIRNHFDNEKGIIDPEYAAGIPEELYEMKEYVNEINSKVSKYYEVANSIALVAKDYIGKERWEYVNRQNSDIPGAIMNLIKYYNDNGSIKYVYDIIFRKVVDELKHD